jgi:hypothetical protein
MGNLLEDCEETAMRVMKQMPIAGVVLLGLFGVACAMDHSLRARSAGRGPVRRMPLEQWENEGGALAPASGGATETSQVPR